MKLEDDEDEAYAPKAAPNSASPDSPNQEDSRGENPNNISTVSGMSQEEEEELLAMEGLSGGNAGSQADSASSSPKVGVKEEKPLSVKMPFSFDRVFRTTCVTLVRKYELINRDELRAAGHPSNPTVGSIPAGRLAFIIGEPRQISGGSIRAQCGCGPVMAPGRVPGSPTLKAPVSSESVKGAAEEKLREAMKPNSGWFTLMKGDGSTTADDVTASLPLSVYTIEAKAGVLCRAGKQTDSAVVGVLSCGDSCLVDEEFRIKKNGNLRVHCVAPADGWFTAEIIVGSLQQRVDGDGIVNTLAQCVGKHDAVGMGMADEEIGAMFGANASPGATAAAKAKIPPRKRMTVEDQRAAAKLLQQAFRR
jgi:hypothetical protein